jgi:adenylate cyclase
VFLKTTSFLIPLAIIALAAMLRFVPQVYEPFSLLSFDLYQWLAPRSYEDAPVRIVEIDDQSLAEVGQWPWPRTAIAELVDKLAAAGAAAIAFDIVFAEPDRLSPKTLGAALSRRATGREVAELIAGLPDTDAILAQAMAAANNVVAGHILVDDAATRTPAQKAGISFSGPDPFVHVKRFAGAVSNLPPIEAAARGGGFLNHDPERDRIVRRVPLLLAINKGEQAPVVYPSLGAESLRVALGASGYLAKGVGASGETGFGQNTGMVALRLGKDPIPTDQQGRVWLHYTGREVDHATRYVSAKDVLGDRVDTNKIKGCIVFVGVTFAGSNDFVATPLQAVVSGVEIHAQLVEQVLQKHFLVQPDWAFGAETLFLAGIGILLVFIIPALGALLGAVVGASSIALAIGASLYAFTVHHLLLDPVYAALVLVLVYGASSLLGYMRTEAQQRAIRNAFTNYMSPELVDELAAHPEKLVLGGEIRTMTLMFCDVRGFTTISEGLSAQELTTFMNSFLSPMTEIIMQNKGYIDKYIGDCIMAFWNAPLDDPDHAESALQAAQGMRRRLVELNTAWEAAALAAGKKHIPLRIGIGINSGECCVGNMGSDLRKNYSVLGDTVNLASRLEGQGKTYHVDLVIGDETAALVPHWPLVEMDLVAVKGKSQAVRIFTMLAEAEPMPKGVKAEAPASYQEHLRLLAAYRTQDWRGALTIIGNGIGQALPQLEGFYELYRERIQHFIEAPPPANWDGVYVAKEK